MNNHNPSPLAHMSAQAIKRACTPKKIDKASWDVDIITMSFGFLIQNNPIAKALREALSYGKVIFAAASNNGSREKIAFPACLGGVISVNSASGDGVASAFNPVADLADKFAVLGENVRSAWISSQPDAAKHEETKIMSGTSMAAPIAAGVFSLLLEVAMNPDGPKSEHIFNYYLPYIRESEAVQTILKTVSDNRGEYMVINLEFLKGVDDRLDFAYWLQRTLRWRYGKPGNSESNRGRSPVPHSRFPALLTCTRPTLCSIPTTNNLPRCRPTFCAARNTARAGRTHVILGAGADQR